jgi:predicted P-loop ATPase
LNKDGTIKPILANLILILCHSPAWKNVLGYDDFNARVVIRGRPPWGEERPDAPLTDHHEAQVRVWFQREAKINPALGDIGRAVQAAARTRSFHPVLDYFKGLKWDGVPRLDHWLSTYFKAEDTPYVRAIGPRWLISAVARIYQPGCKVDHILVAEGLQGKRKSDALRTLAVRDQWFSDRLSHLASKDAMLDVAGVLIVEISEMDALTKASSSTAKSFITQQTDRFRPPYGKHITTLPRQCVFAGTINPQIGGYLKDATGARRFWPVACGLVDRDGIERDRDQLWAEAVQRYEAGKPWHLETAQLEALATAEQAARFKIDMFEEPIIEWLCKRLRNRKDGVTVWDVVEGALKYSRGDATQTIINRAQKVLTRLGFQQHRVRAPGGRENRYSLDPIALEKFLRDHPDQPDHPAKKPTTTTKSTKRKQL